jgi:hypothetical protein
MSKKYNVKIIQRGSGEGTGHQLLGLMSCLAVHGVKDYYFDGNAFKENDFHFAHLTKHEILATKKYFIEIVDGFIQFHNQLVKRYTNIVHSHEIYHIPENYNNDTLYSLNNCYYFSKIPINETEYTHLLLNIQKNKQFFINKQLPQKRICDNNIVIHLRQGDAMRTIRNGKICKYNEQIQQKIQKIIDKYENHEWYIHTDGDPIFLTDVLNKQNIQYHVYDKSENVLNVLSDFIHSKILICGDSSLSVVASFLGNHELVLIPDEIKYCTPENAIKISEFS